MHTIHIIDQIVAILRQTRIHYNIGDLTFLRRFPRGPTVPIPTVNFLHIAEIRRLVPLASNMVRCTLGSFRKVGFDGEMAVLWSWGWVFRGRLCGGWGSVGVVLGCFS